MSRNDSAIKLAKRWVKQVGVRPAIARLISRGVSVATADKICNGRYHSTPKDLLAEVLLDVMGQDGFTLAGDERAS